MQLSEIREEVQLIVNDATFTDEIVDGYINDVYLSVVAECLIPELKGVDTVSTVLGQAYTSLTGVTGGFSGLLSRVYCPVNYNITILSTLESLMDLAGNLTDTGDILYVALEGTVLWYYRIPEVVTVLTLIYYKNPELLSSDSDEPTALPEFTHRKILVNGAASLCFDTVEGGVEGLKVNTRSRELSKLEGVVKLREWLGKNRKHYVKSQEPY